MDVRCRDQTSPHDRHLCSCFFFFNDTATTEIYTLSLHDALPISPVSGRDAGDARAVEYETRDHPLREVDARKALKQLPRSEEHTSELQSRLHLVCRLLLEKKKQRILRR